MIKNYINIALRNLKKHRIYSIINIIGLSIGLTCCMLIAIYVNDELKYDKFHANADRIYRVTRDFFSPDGSTSLRLSAIAPPFAEYFREDFPQMEKICRIAFYGGTIKFEDKIFDEPNVGFADAEIFDVFTFSFLSGNPETVLSQPGSVVITDEIALKYFGTTDAVGEVLVYSDQVNMKVTGIIEKMPENSHFNLEIISDFSTAEMYEGGHESMMQSWGSNNYGTYFLLKDGETIESIERQFGSFLTKHVDEDATKWTNLGIQKMTDIHLRSNLDDEQGLNSDITFVIIFIAIGLLILGIACINYMNLATARSANRAKEVGMRKVMGAGKRSLINQFLSESIILVFLSMAISVIMVSIILPLFREFTERQLTFTETELLISSGILLGFTLLIGVLAGSYPAFYLSTFSPLKVLKGDLSSGAKSSALRKVLVIVQFSISVVLIVSTLVVFKQINYMSNKNLGFDADQLLTFRINDEVREDYQVFKNTLLGHPSITNVASSRRIPSDQLLDSSGAKAEIDGDMQAPEVVIKRLDTGFDFLETYDMEMAAGRWFSRDYSADDTAAFVLNEKAIQVIGWQSDEDAVGKGFSYGGREGRVIGVSKNIHFESLRSEISPVVMFVPRLNNKRFVSVKIQTNDLRETVSFVESTWARFSPNFPLEYRFLDNRFEELYQSEAQRSKLFTGFSSLAIFLACLGLLGLASFTVSQRTKEISIRKVLGASIQSILYILSKEFLLLIGLSVVLASPVAWYFMSDWLQGYAYRIDLELTPFVIAAIVSASIAVLTISLQTLKAAISNPVNGLRDE